MTHIQAQITIKHYKKPQRDVVTVTLSHVYSSAVKRKKEGEEGKTRKNEDINETEV